MSQLATVRTEPVPQSTPPPSVRTAAPTWTATAEVTSAALVTTTQDPTPPNQDDLRDLMLALINEDRATEELSPVEWNELAAQIGQAHAEDMAEEGYMSHWNLAGEGPDLRYSRAGGTAWVQENVYMFWLRYENGTPAPIENWDTVISEAQAALMDSPGHRANIMAPAHTHVGIGISYNAHTGDVRIAQEFLNYYIALDPLPRKVQGGRTVEVRGQLLRGATNPLINLAYEPFREPMTVDEVEARDTYTSPAEFFLASKPQVNEDGTFTTEVTLDHNGLPGIYHIRIWVDVDGESVFASDVVFDVEQ